MLSRLQVQKKNSKRQILLSKHCLTIKHVSVCFKGIHVCGVYVVNSNNKILLFDSLLYSKKGLSHPHIPLKHIVT